MLFNSLGFAVFLPVVFAAYWALPHKYRNIMMLAASYYFYVSFDWRLSFLIVTTTAVSYCTAIAVFKAGTKAKKNAALTICLLVCLGILFFFKYFNFTFSGLSYLISLFGAPAPTFALKIILPVGISFYTFQTLSYVIDVYRGQIEPERNFIVYALYVSFFPQLVAGPIERPQNLIPQIKKPAIFNYNQAVNGAALMLWGFFKKIVIADNLMYFVNNVYSDPQNAYGLSIIFATVLFTFGIYCDFSGYSDIAIGTANLFGVNLMQNFKSPFFARSVREFWTRWHISLSTWFRDYLYIPLGGNRKGKLRRHFNLLVTFAFSGLWHGAALPFLFWGLLHGCYQIVGDITKNARTAFYRALHISEQNFFVKLYKNVFVFALVCFSFLFFRAQDTAQLLQLLANLTTGFVFSVQHVKDVLVHMGFGVGSLLHTALPIALLLAVDFVARKTSYIDVFAKKPAAFRTAFSLALLLAIVFYRAQGVVPFIYFQF